MPDLRQLLDAATPGPWEAIEGSMLGEDADDGDLTASIISEDDESPEAPPRLVAALWSERHEDADAALIVAAVNALPALLAVVDAALTALDYDHDTGCHWLNTPPGPCICWQTALRAALTDLDEVTRA